ncbi:hypothetical protein IWQ56_002649, partial [Coemansia nantahalensis]
PDRSAGARVPQVAGRHAGQHCRQDRSAGRGSRVCARSAAAGQLLCRRQADQRRRERVDEREHRQRRRRSDAGGHRARQGARRARVLPARAGGGRAADLVEQKPRGAGRGRGPTGAAAAGCRVRCTAGRSPDGSCGGARRPALPRQRAAADVGADGAARAEQPGVRGNAAAAGGGAQVHAVPGLCGRAHQPAVGQRRADQRRRSAGQRVAARGGAATNAVPARGLRVGGGPRLDPRVPARAGRRHGLRARAVRVCDAVVDADRRAVCARTGGRRRPVRLAAERPRRAGRVRAAAAAPGARRAVCRPVAPVDRRACRRLRLPSRRRRGPVRARRHDPGPADTAALQDPEKGHV